MRDLQTLQMSINSGSFASVDSLAKIKEFFNGFFAPLTFQGVRIDKQPFGFVVSTPRGEIDIDSLSSGEKEILNLFIRFDQLKPSGAIILFDEADVHLHPDLERRYLELLKELGRGNQFLLTTHSPEMMIAAGSNALFTVLREPLSHDSNQFVRVSDDQHMHETFAALMGGRGIVSFNQRVIFIEGEESSADRLIYEAAYPPSAYNVSFVPVGNSGTARKTAERVNELLGPRPFR